MSKKVVAAISHHEREVAELRADRALSAKGNPTLKTILTVLKAVGMKLSVEPGQRATA
jgi:DNA-binding phage protein